MVKLNQMRSVGGCVFKEVFSLSLLSFGIAAYAGLGALPAKSSKDQDAPVVCAPGPKHMRAAVRHIEAGGIGYQQGYTTFEMFLAQDPNRWVATPFLDLRGHVFNNGQGALNAGIGVRSLLSSRAYGANVYYDYRTTHRRSYNQIGVGVETLGTLWDLRANGYFPVGGTRSSPYDLEFDSFGGHSLFVNRTFQYAMTGCDVEAGFHFGKTEDFDFYAAFGPYYFKGSMGEAAAGGKARIAGYYKEYVSLELSESYDSAFHNRFQGQIAFSFPFGPKARTQVSKSRGVDTCAMATLLNQRMVQPVGRQEIIVVDEHQKNEAADTVLFFVNNLSSSDGTFESPYPTLSEALATAGEGDIIYIYPGDGTSTGLNAGATPFALQNHQQLLGAGVAQTVDTNFGPVTIPAQAELLPYLTADTNVSVIQVASGNTISGLHISVPSGSSFCWGIGSQSGITDLTVRENLLQGQNNHDLFSLVYLEGGVDVSLGTVQIINNQFFGMNTGTYAVYAQKQDPNVLNVLVANNQFTGFRNNGIYWEYDAGTSNMIVRGNQFLNFSSEYAIYTSQYNSSVVNLNYSNNTVVANYGLNLELYDDAIMNTTLASNNIYVIDQALYMYPNHNTVLSVVATNNLIRSDGDTEECILLDAFSNSSTTLFFKDNEIDVSGYDQSAIGFDLRNENQSTLDFQCIGNRITCAGYYEPYGIQFYMTDTAEVTALIQKSTIQALDADDEGYGIETRVLGSSRFDLTIRDNVIAASEFGINMFGAENAVMNATVEQNEISVTRQGNEGVLALFSDNASLTMSCRSNTIAGPVAIGLISASTQPFTAYFVDNDMFGQHADGLIELGCSGTGIMTVGMGSNRLSANTIVNEPAVQIILSAGTVYFDFEQNEVISGGYGIFSDTNTTGSTFVAHVVGNKFQTLSGDFFLAQTDNPNVCIRYEQNLGNTPNVFTNSGGGTFTLYYQGNNQSYMETNTTPGTASSCPFP